MGLFGSSKQKTSAKEFVDEYLDIIFSQNFINSESGNFEVLSNKSSILRNVNVDSFVREKQDVVQNLFQIAWDRNVPNSILTKYVLIISDDPRVNALDSRTYSRSLSRAQKASIDTFEFIASVFLSQLIPNEGNKNDPDYIELLQFIKIDFGKIYFSFEAKIKENKFY